MDSDFEWPCVGDPILGPIEVGLLGAGEDEEAAEDAA